MTPDAFAVWSQHCRLLLSAWHQKMAGDWQSRCTLTWFWALQTTFCVCSGDAELLCSRPHQPEWVCVTFGMSFCGISGKSNCYTLDCFCVASSGATSQHCSFQKCVCERERDLFLALWVKKLNECEKTQHYCLFKSITVLFFCVYVYKYSCICSFIEKI